MNLIALDFFFFIVGAIYLAIAFTAKTSILNRIKEYEQNALFSDGYADISLCRNLNSKKKLIANFGGILWPFYFLFECGILLGNVFFEALLDDKDMKIGAHFI